MMRTELVGPAPPCPPKDDEVKKPCNRELVGKLLSKGMRGTGDVDVEHLKYYCATNIVVPGDHMLEPLVLKNGVGQWFWRDGYLGTPVQATARSLWWGGFTTLI